MINTMPIDMTNTISTNVSPNYDGKKARYETDCYILHTVLLVIIYNSCNRYFFLSLCKKK